MAQTNTDQLATWKALVKGGLQQKGAIEVVDGLNSLYSQKRITAAEIAAWLHDTPFFASVAPHVPALDEREFNRLAERIVTNLGDVGRYASESHIRKGCFLSDVDTTPIAKAVETMKDILRHHPSLDIYDYVVRQSTCITALASLVHKPDDAILATSAVQAILDMAQDASQPPDELERVLEKLSSQYLPHELYRLNEHFLVEGAAEESVLTTARDGVRRILDHYKGLEGEMAEYTDAFNKPTVEKYGRSPLSEILSCMAHFCAEATTLLLQDCSPDPAEQQRLTDLVKKYQDDEEEQLQILGQVNEERLAEKKRNQEANAGPTELRQRVHDLMTTTKPIDDMPELDALADEEGDTGVAVRAQLSGTMYVKTLVSWYGNRNLDFEGKGRLVKILSNVCDLCFDTFQVQPNRYNLVMDDCLEMLVGHVKNHHGYAYTEAMAAICGCMERAPTSPRIDSVIGCLKPAFESVRTGIAKDEDFLFIVITTVKFIAEFPPISSEARAVLHELKAAVAHYAENAENNDLKTRSSEAITALNALPSMETPDNVDDGSAATEPDDDTTGNDTTGKKRLRDADGGGSGGAPTTTKKNKRRGGYVDKGRVAFRQGGGVLVTSRDGEHTCLRDAIANLDDGIPQDVLDSIESPLGKGEDVRFDVAIQAVATCNKTLVKVSKDFLHVKGGPELALLKVDTGRKFVVQLRITYAKSANGGADDKNPDFHCVAYDGIMVKDSHKQTKVKVIQPSDRDKPKEARKVFKSLFRNGAEGLKVELTNVYELVNAGP
jgi:hypothetical protein